MAPELIEGLTGIGSSLVGSLGSLFGANVSQKYNERNMALQNKYAKEMANYMWQNFQSPKAQVAAMGAAGLNPVGMLEHGGSGAFASPSVSMPSSAPINVSGIMDISSLANMLNSVANIRKTGAEVPNIEAATANQVADTEAKKLQNSLTEKFGQQKWISEISLAFQNALLANASTDKTKQETAYQELHNLWQKVINEQEGIKKDILVKERDNTDTRLGLENQLLQEKSKTEKSAQTSNYASANASNTQAEVNRENRRIQSALADIEEQGKNARIEALISEYESKKWLTEAEANEARIKASRLHDVELRRDQSVLFREIDNLSEWIKSKIKIFGK